MKKRTLLFPIIMIFWNIGFTLLAQPVLEHSYSESVAIASLENSGEVYYAMDVVSKQCLISKMDHSHWKSIPLPTPEGYYLADIRHVSEHLFNKDDLVELVYIYTKYVPTETSYYYSFEAKLINENGTVLETFPGAGYTELIETTAYGKKFLVYQYDYSLIPYRTYTHVYGLPEAPVKSQEEFSILTEPGLPYPNPAKEQVTLPIRFPAQAPGGAGSGTLHLYDMSGKLILEYPVKRSEEHVVVSTRNLKPGTYLYHISSGGIRTMAKKLLIR